MQVLNFCYKGSCQQTIIIVIFNSLSPIDTSSAIEPLSQDTSRSELVSICTAVVHHSLKQAALERAAAAMHVRMLLYHMHQAYHTEFKTYN